MKRTDLIITWASGIGIVLLCSTFPIAIIAMALRGN